MILVLQSALWKYFDETITKPAALVYGLSALTILGMGGLYGLQKIGLL